MSSPCENTDIIRQYGRDISGLSSSQNSLIAAQTRVEKGQQLMIDELRSVLKDIKDMFGTSIEQKKDIQSLREQQNILFEKLRELKTLINESMVRNNRELETLLLWKATIESRLDFHDIDELSTFVVKNSDIKKYVEDHERFIQQEKGWRRTVPTIISVVAVLISLATYVVNTNNNNLEKRKGVISNEETR